MVSRKKLYITQTNLVTVEPIGSAQGTTFEEYAKGKNLFLTGSAGTGKTFVLLYLALKEVLDKETPYEQIVIVRSLLPSREIGYLPGDLAEKSMLYQNSYRYLVRYLFEMPSEQEFDLLYDNLTSQGTIEFVSTSFLRGMTFDRSVVIADECQNMTFQELDTITTRIGQDSKIMYAGDEGQADIHERDKNGYYNFQGIVDEMEEVEVIQFGIGDIVRSGFARSYLIAKRNAGIRQET